jgi:tyrosinase
MVVINSGLVLAVAALFAGSTLSAPTAIPTFTAEEINSGKAIQALGKLAYDNAMARLAKSTSGCTKDNVKIRKEWWVA